MKAIDVIRDKGFGAVGNLAGKAFSTAKDKIMSLMRKKPPPVTSPMLPSTTVMPAKISKAINSAVEKKIMSLADSVAPSPVTDSAIMSAIAGSGLNSKNFKRKRNLTNFQRR